MLIEETIICMTEAGTGPFAHNTSRPSHFNAYLQVLPVSYSPPRGDLGISASLNRIDRTRQIDAQMADTETQSTSQTDSSTYNAKSCFNRV
jgi:hypothetical protein